MDGCRPPATSAGWSLSLVIPAYNEAAGIHHAVAEADRALADLCRDYEILVVDDGSTDGTAEAVRAVGQECHHIRLLRHATNRGYGAALRTGFEAARCERVAFTDADCQFQLSDLGRLLPLTEEAPLVVGYRIGRQDPWPRRFFSWGYNTLVRALLGTRVRDCDCALKVFRKEALTDLLPQTRGFFVNAELLCRARQLGYAVVELGVRHRPRLHGGSKVSLWDIPRTLAALLPFWWSQMLFRGRDDEHPAVRGEARGSSPSHTLGPILDPRSSILNPLLVVLIAALLFFSRLGCPLQEPEEPRYAEIPRQMLHAGQFAVPILYGQPYYDKPPLLYWLVMASYSLFGVSDWSARLVSCGAAFLTVVVTYAWGRRVVGVRAALAGAVMLCLSTRFVYLGRLLTTNILLCLWVVSALAAAHLALHGPRLRKGWWLLSALACGLGLLTKGPVALVLVAGPVLAYQALDPRAARPRFSAWMAYLAAALALAAPWYLAVAARDPDFATHFLWKHNVVRYLAPFDHEEPAWFYLPSLLLGMLPWSLLLVPLVQFLSRRDAETAALRSPALGFCLLASLWCFVFYSAAGCKRPGYILPAMPPLALALGCYLETMLAAETNRRGERWAASPWARFGQRSTLLVLAAAIGGSGLALATGVLKPAGAGTLAAASVLAFAATYYYCRGWRPERAWFLCAGTTLVLLVAAVHLALPAYARRFSLRGQVRRQAELCADGRLPVVCYPRCWDSVGFYLHRSDVLTYPRERRQDLIATLIERPQALVFVKAGGALEDLMAELPASLEFVPCGRRGPVSAGLIRTRLEPPLSLLAQQLDRPKAESHRTESHKPEAQAK